MSNKVYGEIGNCFVSAFKDMKANPYKTLVHGLVYNSRIDVMMPHAWAEYNNMCFDYSNGNKIEVSQEFYHQISKCDNIIMYTYKEMIELVEETHIIGIWDKDLLKQQEIAIKKEKELYAK